MGRRQGKSEEGNGVASPLSSLFSPIPAVRLTPATVDHSKLPAGIREGLVGGAIFVTKRARVSQPGRHSYAPLAVKPVPQSDITN